MFGKSLTSKNNNNKAYVDSGFSNIPYSKIEKLETPKITQSFLNQNIEC